MDSWRIDPPGYAQVLQVWRCNRCVGPGSIAVYRYWICRYYDYCRACRLDERKELTELGAERFAKWWRSRGSPRRGHFRSAFLSSRSALRAWSFARTSLGETLPTWRMDRERPVPRALRCFAAYMAEVRGNPPQTIRKKIVHLGMFATYCRKHRRSVQHLRLQDIDQFVIVCRARYARTTVSDICSTLRAYLRFLRATGRSRNDLSGSILSPTVRSQERPHRALPWKDAQRILQAVDRSYPTGLRDYALLLMMSVYGLGAGEVIGLTVDDINWRSGTLHIQRPKNRVEFLLPLLPAVAKALAAYLKRGRPPRTDTRRLFVTMRTPFKPLACAVTVRHILHSAAARARVSAPFLGTHVLRHTHACRQLELGTPPKIIGDVLGHRDPDSTSAYLRVATNRLRDLALPVPA
jgi:integrase/recombinase XerD